MVLKKRKLFLYGIPSLLVLAAAAVLLLFLAGPERKKDQTQGRQENMMLEALVRRFLYYPTSVPQNAPPPYWVVGAREVFIDASDGNRIHALLWPAPEGRPTILFLHGNAQTVFEWSLIREELEPMDCGLLLIDYPGYGKSTGAPSEESNYAAGRAAFAWLLGNGVAENRIVLFGKSLGGGVVTELGKDAGVYGVILESTFTSIPAVARRLLPMIPSDAIFKSERYDSISKIKSIRAPVLVIHGTRDDLIPVEEGKNLFEAANEPKKLYLVEGAGHNDVSSVAGSDYGRALRAWLSRGGASLNGK